MKFPPPATSVAHQAHVRTPLFAFGKARAKTKQRRSFAFSLLLLAVFGLGCSGLRPSGDMPGSGTETNRSRTVGVRTLEIVDAKRARALTTELWYPTAAGHESSQGYFFVFRSGSAVRDANILPGQHALILLSHGSGGTRFDQAWLAEYLAAQGFVVAAMIHPGNTYGDNDPGRSLEIWDRPQDVGVVLDHLLADKALAAFIDPNRIGAAGHSMGGYTVLAVAGARYDVQRARKHCLQTDRDPPCDFVAGVDRSTIDYGPSNNSYRDARVKAVMAFAPAVGPGLDLDSVSEVTVPIHIVSGRQDQLTPFEFHARPWATALDAELTVIGNADHYAFISRCHPVVKLWPWANACHDPAGFDRASLHRRLAQLATAYFEQHL